MFSSFIKSLDCFHEALCIIPTLAGSGPHPLLFGIGLNVMILCEIPLRERLYKDPPQGGVLTPGSYRAHQLCCVHFIILFNDWKPAASLTRWFGNRLKLARNCARSIWNHFRGMWAWVVLFVSINLSSSVACEPQAANNQRPANVWNDLESTQTLLSKEQVGETKLNGLLLFQPIMRHNGKERKVRIESEMDSTLQVFWTFAFIPSSRQRADYH